MTDPSYAWLGHAGSLLAALGFAVATHVVLFSPASGACRLVCRYRARLDADLRFLRIDAAGSTVFACQTAAVLLLPAAAALSGKWPLLLLIPVAMLAPSLWLNAERARRVVRIEQQLDGWLLALANALKASASLGDAVATSARLMHAPIGHEIDQTLKEYRLGTPLDEAMENMEGRVGSRVLRSALLTLRVARNAGGDLPTVLETAAAGLREFARLEGVARTKTSEGKAQAFVVAIIPFPLFGVLHYIDPDFLRPLADTFTGHLVVAGAAALWLCAIFVAHKVLAVDI